MSITRSSCVGGLPRSTAEPLPRGATASRSADASASSRPTSSMEPGRATQRGSRPSHAEPASATGSADRCSPPTMPASALSSAGAETVTLSDPRPGGQTRRRGPEHLAAGRMRGQELARVHDPVGIEDTTEPGHEGEVGVGELERHVRGLVEAHPMLARDAAAHGKARPQQLVVGFLGALELARDPVIVEDQRVEIAVTRVEDIGDDQPLPRRDGLHLAHDLRQAGAWDDGILEKPRGRYAPEDPGGLLPALPQERPLRLVLRHTDLERRVAPAHLDDPGRLRVDLLQGPVELDEQHGRSSLRIARADTLFDSADDDLVDHLERGRDDAGTDDG